MKILHPFTGLRPTDESETWAFLGELRSKYDIIDRLMGVENGFARSAYIDFLKEFWGTDDIIIIEDDKVPTVADLHELITCPRDACCFPYASLGVAKFDMGYWREYHPNTLGFVKFSLKAQEAAPVIDWNYSVDRRSLYPFVPVDLIIESVMTARLGPLHLHEREIKHNHRARRAE